MKTTRLLGTDLEAKGLIHVKVDLTHDTKTDTVRFAFAPDASVEGQLDTLDASLVRDGYPPFTEDERWQVTSTAERHWTPERRAEFRSGLAAPQPNPLDQTLTKRQVCAALIIGAQVEDPEAAITAAIKSIPDPVQRALALNDWRNAPYYARNHALFNEPALLRAMNIHPDTADQLWLLGVTLPA